MRLTNLVGKGPFGRWPVSTWAQGKILEVQRSMAKLVSPSVSELCPETQATLLFMAIWVATHPTCTGFSPVSCRGKLRHRAMKEIV